MQTVTIKINDSKAFKLLEDLEALKLIEVVKKTVAKKSGKKLSERLAGSITSKQATAMHKELKQMRNEWQRDI